MKKIAFVSLMFFVMALFSVTAIPAEDTDDVKIGKAAAGLQTSNTMWISQVLSGSASLWESMLLQIPDSGICILP